MRFKLGHCDLKLLKRVQCYGQNICRASVYALDASVNEIKSTVPMFC